MVCKKIVPTRWFPNSKWTDGLWMFCNKQFLFAPRRFPDNNLQRGITLSTDKEAATKPSNFLKHAKAPAIVYRTSLHDVSYTSQFNTIHMYNICNYTHSFVLSEFSHCIFSPHLPILIIGILSANLCLC